MLIKELLKLNEAQHAETADVITYLEGLGLKVGNVRNRAGDSFATLLTPIEKAVEVMTKKFGKPKTKNMYADDVGSGKPDRFEWSVDEGQAGKHRIEFYKNSQRNHEWTVNLMDRP